MKDLLDKLSSYNVFNYLLPGVIFAAFVDHFTTFQIIQENLVIGVFVYYFLGSIVSRIGSLFIEPILKKLKILKFADYEDFVHASKLDSKLETLSEANNMYRTFCALMLAIGVVISYDQLSFQWSVLDSVAPWILLIGLLMLYLFSYRKQTTYITKRVKANLKQAAMKDSNDQKI